MLTQEKIAANAKKFFDTANKNEFMNEEFMNFLTQNGIVQAAASTAVNLNNAFEGGLIDHLIRVGKYAVNFNLSLPEDEQVELKSLLKVCFLSQTGKILLYKPNPSQWHREKLGKMYEFNNDLVAMRVGERSLFYANRFGINFTEEEYAAVLNLDKEDDSMSEYHNSILGELLKAGNKFAVKHEKTLFKKSEIKI